MEITGSGESYGQGGVSFGENEAERLAEQGILVEENSTLDTKLTSSEAVRISVETKSSQQQTAYEIHLAKHKALLSDHETLKKDHAAIHKKYDGDMKKHDALKVELNAVAHNHKTLKKEHAEEKMKHDALKTQHNTLLSVHETLKKEHAVIHKKYDGERDKHDTLRTEHNAFVSDYETLKKEHAAIHKKYDGEKEKCDRLSAEYQDLQEKLDKSKRGELFTVFWNGIGYCREVSQLQIMGHLQTKWYQSFVPVNDWNLQCEKAHITKGRSKWYIFSQHPKSIMCNYLNITDRYYSCNIEGPGVNSLRPSDA